MTRLWHIYFIFLIFQDIETKKKSRSVYFLDTKTIINPIYIKRLQLNISADKTSMNIMFETNIDIAELWAKMGISVWQRPTKQYLSMFSYDIDLCETLARVSSVNIAMLNVWISNFLKYGNMSTQCPFPKNVYFIENLKPDKKSLPPFAPSGKFRTSVVFYKKETNGSTEIMGDTQMAFELK